MVLTFMDVKMNCTILLVPFMMYPSLSLCILTLEAFTLKLLFKRSIMISDIPYSSLLQLGFVKYTFLSITDTMILTSVDV